MQADSTKEYILMVATKVFKKFGFQKTTVNEIARAAHKTKGSVYYHFKSKENLFQNVLEKEFQTIQTEQAKAIDEGVTARQKLINYITLRMNKLRNFSERYFLSEKDNPIYNSIAVGEVREKYEDKEIYLVKSILTNGVTNNEFDIKDEEQTAYTIITALKGFEVPVFVNNRFNKIEERIGYMADLLLRGIERR